MLIFVDSNILCSDYHMTNYKFELINRIGTIVLSEVVIDEVCNKYKEQLTTSIYSIDKNVRIINKLLSSNLGFNKISIDTEVQKYRNFLEMYSIQSGMTVAEVYPSVPHKEIVNRALLRKKPFKQDGSTGYRDYLVWLTCIDLARTYASEEIHFITQNINDFSDLQDKKKLHEDLIIDLREANIDCNRFYYWISINDFIDYIQPRIHALENKESIKSHIETNTNYSSMIYDFIDKSISGIALSSHSVLVPGRNVSLKNVEESYNNNIEGISLLQEDEYLLEITVDSICLVEATMRKEDYNEIKDYEEYEICGVEIIEYELCRVCFRIGLMIHLNAKYNNKTSLIESIQLDYIDDYNCDFCN